LGESNRMVDNRIIRYAGWERFDPKRLDARIEVDAAGIDFGAVYTCHAEHAGTVFQFLGCRPKPSRPGKAVFDLSDASVVLTGPLGWTGNALWPPDREDQPRSE
jgi:hypothetical protein